MIIGALYSSVFFVAVNNCQTVQPVVAIERTVFYREKTVGMYSALPYAIAQVRESENEFTLKTIKQVMLTVFPFAAYA